MKYKVRMKFSENHLLLYLLCAIVANRHFASVLPLCKQLYYGSLKEVNIFFHPLLTRTFCVVDQLHSRTNTWPQWQVRKTATMGHSVRRLAEWDLDSPRRFESKLVRHFFVCFCRRVIFLVFHFFSNQNPATVIVLSLKTFNAAKTHWGCQSSWVKTF